MKKSILTLLLLISLSLPVQAQSKSHVKSGALIGGASGLGLGLVSSLIVANHFGCAKSNGADESCASTQTQTYIVLGSTLGSAAIGTGLGALIGSLIPKKQNLSVIPLVSHDPQSGTMGGLLMTKDF